MVVFADLDFYKEVFVGARNPAIPFTDFDYWALRASVEIQSLILRRLTKEDITDDLRYCTCEVAEHLYRQSGLKQADRLKSESTDGYSVSYANEAQKPIDVSAESRAIMHNWLWLTGWLYGGLL